MARFQSVDKHRLYMLWARPVDWGLQKYRLLFGWKMVKPRISPLLLKTKINPSGLAVIAYLWSTPGFDPSIPHLWMTALMDAAVPNLLLSKLNTLWFQTQAHRKARKHIQLSRSVLRACNTLFVVYPRVSQPFPHQDARMQFCIVIKTPTPSVDIWLMNFYY